jgi:hypothetical protein
MCAVETRFDKCLSPRAHPLHIAVWHSRPHRQHTVGHLMIFFMRRTWRSVRTLRPVAEVVVVVSDASRRTDRGTTTERLQRGLGCALLVLARRSCRLTVGIARVRSIQPKRWLVRHAPHSTSE